MKTIRGVGPNLKSFFYHVCLPENFNDVKGVVLVLHGAEGHGGRYESFGNELARHGYAMYAIDHIGHGLTVLDKKEDLGKWKKDDFHLSTYNAYYLVDVIKRTHPNKPVILLGHDYGGTMAQYMMGKFENSVDGVIISSCGMPSRRDWWVFFTVWLKKVLLYDNNMSKGTFKRKTRFLNYHYRPNRTKYDWLNSVPEEVDRFIEDPLSGYVCTIAYYYYQYKYIVSTPYLVKLKDVNRSTPILLLGGKEDYITMRGKKVEALARYYDHKNFENVSTKIYPNSRHDVLLEWNKEEVARDIANWIDENILHSSEPTYTINYKPNDKKQIEQIKTPVEHVSSWSSSNLEEEEPEDELRLNTELKE